MVIYSDFILIFFIIENRVFEILFYKKENGNFKIVEELFNVKGIGV